MALFNKNEEKKASDTAKDITKVTPIKMADPNDPNVSSSLKSGEIITGDVSGSKTLSLATFDDALGEMDTGLENVTAKDLLIPRLTILQALSPQLKANKPEFIKGAKVGMICDTAMGEVIGDGEAPAQMLFLPCYYATIYLEWAPNRGGLVANHGVDPTAYNKCIVDEKQKRWTGPRVGEGNNISEVATFYGLNLTLGGRRSFLPLSSTALKASRRWMTLITAERRKRRDGTEYQPPIFGRAWLAEVTHESKGDNDWFGWKFTAADGIEVLDPTMGLLREAKEFMEQARSGLVTGDLGSYADDGTDGAPRDITPPKDGEDRTIDQSRAM